MVSGPLRWMSDNPLRTASLVAALAAALYVVVSSAVPETGSTATVPTTVTPSAVVDFSLAHPAYPVVAVLGVLAFLVLD